jgi:hypothetical protein
VFSPTVSHNRKIQLKIMYKHDLNRGEFYLKEDMAGVNYLSKVEHIFRNETKSVCSLI